MSTYHRPAGTGAATDGGPSPYLIGAAIGLLNIFAFAAFRKGIGVSGAYESSAALVARRLAPDAAHVNDYVKARKEPPKFNSESWLVLGTILGGMAAARTFGGSADPGMDALVASQRCRWGDADVRRPHGGRLHQRTCAVRHRTGCGVELVVHTADVRGRIVSGAKSARRPASKQESLMAEMSKFTQNALGLATGIIFGALLQRGRLADSRTIVGQLTGDDSRVAKTMGTAVAVGALGHRLLCRRGMATAEPKPMSPVGLVGGAVLFGAGMALSGYCPGTAAAAAGSGRREGVSAMAGMLAAAALFVATYPRLKKALEGGSLGRVNLLGGNPARPAPPPLDVVVRPRAAPDAGFPMVS